MNLLLLATFFLPAAFFSLVWALLPTQEETPRWKVRLARAIERLVARLRRPRVAPPDPFHALEVQARLGAVARHALELESEPHTFALAERLIATQLAYDDLLAEACAMAHVTVLPRAKGDRQERFREEVELVERGWTW